MRFSFTETKTNHYIYDNTKKQILFLSPLQQIILCALPVFMKFLKPPDYDYLHFIDDKTEVTPLS